jgi:uncharacterized protein
MNIAITGSSGLIGTELCHLLESRGHQLLRIVRREPRSVAELRWEPDLGHIDPRALEGVDALIHLAGEPIAPRRWTPRVKRLILDSRLKGTTLIARTLASLPTPPRAFLSASGIGYYGATGDRAVTESDPRGQGFLADVCAQWEAATTTASSAGIRTSLMRIGAVLSPRGGGALKAMLPAFRAGLGGPIGQGRQPFSWISVTDCARAMEHLLTEDLPGPVNLCAPTPIPSREFAKALGRALHRPAVIPMPAAAMRLIFGQMARETLLETALVTPARLIASGFRFEHPTIDAALEHLLKIRPKEP